VPEHDPIGRNFEEYPHGSQALAHIEAHHAELPVADLIENLAVPLIVEPCVESEGMLHRRHLRRWKKLGETGAEEFADVDLHRSASSNAQLLCLSLSPLNVGLGDLAGH
jgi:hypothetical protein